MSTRRRSHVVRDASVIISTRDRPQFVVDTVKSILDGERIPAEIVVIDQSKQPNAVLPGLAVPRGCRIRYRASQARGLSNGRNEGIAVATCNRLVFTDDDVLVTPTWLATLIEESDKQGDTAVISGRVEATRSQQAGAFAPSTTTGDRSRTFHGRVAADPLSPPNMLIPRAVLEATGPFDVDLGAGARFAAAEDNDMGYRILTAGYPIVFTTDSVVLHRDWRGRADFLPLRWNYGRGQGAFFAKYVRQGDAFMHARLRHVLRRRTRHAVTSLARRPGVTAGEVAYLGGFFSGFVEHTLRASLGRLTGHAVERGDSRR